MSKTYEELEAENQMLEVELKKTQAKLARVKAKTCKDCVKLFEEMAAKQLAERSCKTCAHDKCGQCVEIAIYWQGDCDSAKVNYCSLWRAKK